MKRFSYFVRCVPLILVCALFALPASAALIFSEPSQIQVAPQQLFEVGLFLDTQNDDINALEGTLIYPTDLLELKEVRDGNSIINFWVEHPSLNQGPVGFSGIIPGGYRFPKGTIFTLVFQAKGEGNGTIRIDTARTLRNDGQGTEAPLTLAFSSVTVSEHPQFPLPRVSEIIDTAAPESFLPEVSRDSAVFSDQWFLSFATQDKQSGIDRYEVRETYAWGKGSWEMAKSPYVLHGQNPSLPIEVKAVDKAGNVRIEKASMIAHVPTPIETAVFYGICILAALLFLFSRRMVIEEIVKRIRRK